MDRTDPWGKYAALAWLVILLTAWLSFIAGLWLWSFDKGGHFLWLALFWLALVVFTLAVKDASKKRR